MERRWLPFMVLSWFLVRAGRAAEVNRPPVFTQDMNNLLLSEATPVGDVVYTLHGNDPEGSPIKYGLAGTDRFSVDPISGEITLVQHLDREVNDTLKFLVSIEDQVPDADNNKVQVPFTVIVLDENDNAPEFKNAPYEVDVPENEKVGKTILDGIQVADVDEVGESLEVSCVPNPQWPEACSMFRVVSLLSTQNQYTGALVLDAPLDYNEKQFYQFALLATDGALNSTTSVEIKVSDVQNLPPVFSGSVTGALSEDAPVGTLVLQLKARDGDRANSRDIAYDLLTNPHDFFLLDSATGELRTAKPLDREALADPSSPLNLTVRAREIVNGQPVTSELTASVATITVTIKDVNDEPPRFNRAEYSVEIAENLPVGTPLPNLDMLVTDTDLGVNSAFSLRVSDAWGGFSVEPQHAVGSTPVTLRLNRTLDYEDPNQRKFILVVIAEETASAVRLSSKAIVHVSVVDANDNAPQFGEEAYSVAVREDAARGARLATITAADRDSGRFGSDGIVYQLFGNGAELFAVDNRTGDITVADCATNCLDLETRKDYFLNYKATDEDGQGQTKVVSLKVSLLDANDNAPTFTQPLYRAAIDEDATKFEPDLQVKARDADTTSEIRYSIVGDDDTFWIDPLTGKLGVRPGAQIRAANSTVALTVQASDGVHNATAVVEIVVRDVNNHAPAFERATYNASVSEDAALGTEVARVSATDLDSGANADIRYSIQKGALDAFAIDNGTGAVTLASKLDYDKRNTYRIQIVAADQGMPSLTGTTELTVTVVNANDKKPYFTPQIQRAEVSADAEVGTTLHTLVAMDPDITDNVDLKYDLSADRALKIVDKNGKEVPDAGDFRNWFTVLSDGAVTVSAKLDRNRAAVMTLPVTVTDTSAPNLQMADGDLIVTIVDVNRHAPRFAQSVYTERVPEEQPIGHVLNTFTATDKESAIAAYAIEPANPYFAIDNVTGVVKSTQRIDYERVKKINFTLVAYDSGVPQLSTSALVLVEVGNSNDEEPRFDTPEGYEATVTENAGEGTPILTVHAVDADDGPFGEVRYGLTGEQASLFRIDPMGGQITVGPGAVIDRELTADIYLRATAADDAPPELRNTVSVPIHIKVLDANDNAPVFSQRAYQATIAENLQLSPPAAILHVRADDADAGLNAQVTYAILEQSAPGTFTVDNSSGIIYPARAVSGNTTYWLTVTATDRGGQGLADTARVDIHVTSVNQHRPVFSAAQTTIEVPENAAQADLLVTKVHATDGDPGENGRVSYFLKVGNRNVLETGEFSIDETSGEIRTRSFLDREHSDSYQLVVVARDHGSPAPFEELLFLTVVLQDANDNMPRFPRHLYEFSVVENQPAGIIIGSVKAQDKDSGENGRIFYHILEGNQAGAFTLDRTQGLLRANVSFDREKLSEYRITVHASNEPVLDRGALSSGDTDGNSTSYSENDNVATVLIKVLDLNDNEPTFTEPAYYAGIRYTAGVGEAIISTVASDPDAEENGTLSYIIAASHLYAVGASKSSGSIVPSPFNVSAGGVVSTASAMAEYNQERFVLDVIAQETAAPFRQAKAQLYIWVVSADQQFRVVVSRGCGEGRGSGSGGGVPDGGASLGARLAAQLGSAAGARLVPAPLARYVHVDTVYSHWCQLHYHAVEAGTQRVLPVGGVLAQLDARYDELRDLYAAAGIETVDAAAAAAAGKVVERFDPALAALIALLIVLFTGIVTFIVVCACLKHWVIAPPSLESSKGDSLARRRILEELSTTENPLWLENKLRPYEEQELTMNVFGDQNEQPNGDSPVDNTYATIAGRGGAGGACGPRGGGGGDYATLGAESPTPLEAMLGFQGSTFQPLAPDTPEPPPRPAPSLQNIP